MLPIQHRVELIDAGTKVCGIAAEGDVEEVEEFVHAVQQSLGSVGPAFDSWLALVNDDLVGQIGGHDEIVFYDEGCLFVVDDESLDDSSADDTLLDV